MCFKNLLAQANEARQQANRRYDAILSREQVLEQIRNAFGATQRELDVVRVIMDMFAEQWAERTGRPADEWWQRIAGVERDGEGALSQASSDILRLAETYGIARRRAKKERRTTA